MLSVETFFGATSNEVEKKNSNQIMILTLFEYSLEAC